MKKNVGSVDKIIRFIAALTIVVLILADVLTGAWVWILGAVAVVLVATSLVSVCPLYLALGLSSSEKSTQAPAKQ